MQLHRHCRELSVRRLDEPAVAEYLARRCPVKTEQTAVLVHHEERVPVDARGLARQGDRASGGAVRTHSPSRSTSTSLVTRSSTTTGSLARFEIARRQDARWLELRAIVSISRVRQRQGRTNEARHRLAELCGWFTEGLATADLQEARALLES
jgi:hypothetical protein